MEASVGISILALIAYARSYYFNTHAHVYAKNAQLSGFIFGLPHFFMCADESDIWSTYVSNSFDDYVPEDVVHVFHLFNHIAYARRYY